MTDQDKTKDQLIQELQGLRSRVADLESLNLEALSSEEQLTAASQCLITSDQELIANNQALQREQFFRGLLEAAPDAIVIVDQDGRIVLANAKAVRLFGYARGEMLGQPIEMLIPKRYRGKYRKKRQCCNSGPHLRPQDSDLSLYGLRKDGGEFPCEINIAPLETEQGILVSSVIRDVSKHKQTHDTLRTAKEAAEASNLAKGEFLANMSHEIRTPLNAVIGMTELLLDTELRDEQREFAETVGRAADSLLAVINDILDYSKIEAGKLDIEPIPFDLQMTLEGVVELLSEKALAKQIELVMWYPPLAVNRVIGDPGRIRQVLTNLVNNAIKFTQKGRVFIHVEALDQNSTEVTLKISVEDSGIGIPEDKLKHIFDKFTQADASTTRNYGGTGLGLAISKQLVELMGGSIGVTSQPGQGSTFSFTLPLPLDAQIRNEPPPPADLTGLRTLVVDASRINRRILVELTGSWGMRTEGFASGEEALSAIYGARKNDDPYKMVIVDHNLLDLDGEVLGKTLKADIELQDTVIVMFTSVARRGDAKRLKEIGFGAYLTKPIRPSRLLEALVSVWSAKTQSATPDLITRHTLAEARKEKASSSGSNTSFAKRVLLVEDNMDNQTLGVRLLTKFGCRVDVAGNGIEAIEMVEKSTYDLVFMDCQMPELDGYQATVEIRQREGNDRHIPIIAMTANAMQGDRQRCLESGMDDYITKPIRREELRKCLEFRTVSSLQDLSNGRTK